LPVIKHGWFGGSGLRKFATPELLEIERRLIEAAVGRAGEQAVVCSHDTLSRLVGVLWLAGR
jgi:hypothetical protein